MDRDNNNLFIQMINNLGSIIKLFRIKFSSKSLSKHKHKKCHNHILPKICKRQILFRKNKKLLKMKYKVMKKMIKVMIELKMKINKNQSINIKMIQ